MSTLETPADFYFQGAPYPNYLTARHEVNRWLAAWGSRALDRLIEALRNRADSEEAYRSTRPADAED